MAKWTCNCGHIMDDHKGPDENYFRVYSDLTWNEISSDENGNVNFFEDIHVPTFNVYRCPKCERLMVFGEGNSFTSYKKEES